MILECDQCHTKFRLDDSKLKPGGVKVRCSKCRHVFVAGAETEPRQEESDFDALLSGLGAPTPPKPSAPEEEDFGFEPQAATQVPPAAELPQPAPSAPADDFGDLASFDFTAGPAAEAPKAPEAPAPQDEFGDFDFAAPSEAAPEPPKASAAPAEFEDFDFAASSEAAPEPPKASAAPDEFEDFDFAASSEPAPVPSQASAAPAEFGEFDFDAAPQAAAEPSQAPAAPSGFEDFDFAPSEEPPPLEEAPAAAPSLEFGEFAFPEEPAAAESAPQQGAPAAPAPPGEGFEFEDFTINPEGSVAPVTPAAVGAGFGEFEFSEETLAAPKEAAAEQPFGEFSFGEEPEQPASSQPASALASPEAPLEFGEFSFGEEPPQLGESPTPEPAGDFGSLSFSAPEPEAPKAPEEPVPAKEEFFGIGSLSLPAEDKGPAPAAAPETSLAALGAEEPAPQEAKQPFGKSSLDFSFGAKPSAGVAAPGLEEGEEELPPLSITSRRKGRSWFTASVVTLAVLVILALTGAGLYLLQSGPSALQKLDKVGLGFVGKWFGVEAPEEGRIVINKPLASFVANKEAGELFVVNGDAVNNFKKPRASIRVKVSVFDSKGAVVAQKTAFCGNKLSKDQLETLPMTKLDAAMNNQFGDSLSNMGVKPGKSISFVVAIPNVPKDAVDFAVESIGSTVAAGQ
ncbi:zinc-ribbon domain-containing protein [Geomonas sp. Red32]|uniref:DUF3426 domain-containing protein n=1 Tax=Geomonas sp. Red32 TaxID=2912856 RepID=UPI00202CC6AF|nr:DUF3426 domain-containing protein [Geomonas sp. Red32]MCM0082213.1 zinc-ribbon domain-containing protein [Geomonas sp. Red32]